MRHTHSRTHDRHCAAFMLALVLALYPLTAFASGNSPESLDHAEKLWTLHLFRGTSINPDGTPVYSLGQTPTRLQGLIMLIRLLGAEEEALAGEGITPFVDVSGEPAQYVAYAYERGITNGTTAATFSPGDTLSSRGYVTFLLRALGYSEEAGDFEWGGQMALAASIGMVTEETAVLLDNISLNRGDVADLSYAALTCRVKGQARTLADRLCLDGVFTHAEGVEAGVLGAQAGWTFSYVPPDDTTVLYEKRNVGTSEGTVTAHILTVNTSNPAVSVRAAMVDNTLGHTASLSRIVQNSGALAVVNGNFFSSYSAFKAPIGHVMVDGEFLYANSGLTSLGITGDGEVRIGRPAVFTRLSSGDDEWTIYEINTAEQTDETSVLYTPAYGERVTFQNGGWALVAGGGLIREFYSVNPDASITIPPDGFAVYMGYGYASTPYFRIPQIGSEIAMEYYLRAEDEDGFSLDGVENIVSGAPRLVRRGEIATELEEGFNEARFTTLSAPRTAVGVHADGKLLIVSVPGGATIQQMRELMLSLGCMEAFNLDGGASCGLYYQGASLAIPTRELTVTLQVFVDE